MSDGQLRMSTLCITSCHPHSLLIIITADMQWDKFWKLFPNLYNHPNHQLAGRQTAQRSFRSRVPPWSTSCGRSMFECLLALIFTASASKN